LTRSNCVLRLPQVLEEIRRDLAEFHPELEETELNCLHCREKHTLRLQGLQLAVPGGPATDKSPATSRLPRAPSRAAPNWCWYHRTSETWLVGPCAYCNAEMHVHLTQVGKAKGELVTEKCSKCHRFNSVRPQRAIDWQLKRKDRVSGVVQFMRIDAGVPVKQGLLIR